MASLILLNSLPALPALAPDWRRKSMAGAAASRYSTALVRGLAKEHGPPVWQLEVEPNRKVAFSRAYVHLMPRLDVPIFVFLQREVMPSGAPDLYTHAQTLLLKWFDGSKRAVEKREVHEAVVASLLTNTRAPDL